MGGHRCHSKLQIRKHESLSQSSKTEHPVLVALFTSILNESQYAFQAYLHTISCPSLPETLPSCRAPASVITSHQGQMLVAQPTYPL